MVENEVCGNSRKCNLKIALISIYPDNKSDIPMGGVASYTRELVQSMARTGGHEFYVLSNMLDRPEEYHDNLVIIKRCFTRNLRFIFQVRRQIRAVDPDIVHFQHELTIFGGYLTAFLAPFVLSRGRRRRTITTLHGVLSLGNINREFIKSNRLRVHPWLIRRSLICIVTALVARSDKIIVHEDSLRLRLITEYGAPAAKVVVIPHGVRPQEPLDRAEARVVLDIGRDRNVVLFMGYVTGYKGLDQLIESFASYSLEDRRALLLLGGGEHPRLAKYSSYRKNEYARLFEKAKALIPPDNYRWVGYIPEEQIRLFFSAADLSVFPYTVGMAASGPMAISIGYDLPFVTSSEMGSLFPDGYDVIDVTGGGIHEAFTGYFKDPSRYRRLLSRLREDRSWIRVGTLTLVEYNSLLESELTLKNAVQRDLP